MSEAEYQHHETELWVTAEQVAQHLGVAKDNFYRWRKRRGVPVHRIGRLWKFKLSDVDSWVCADGADDTIYQHDHP